MMMFTSSDIEKRGGQGGDARAGGGGWQKGFLGALFSICQNMNIIIYYLSYIK
jgi:hypothetical protein